MDPNEVAKLKNLDLRTTIEMLRNFVLILNHAEELLACAIQAADELGQTVAPAASPSAAPAAASSDDNKSTDETVH